MMRFPGRSIIGNFNIISCYAYLGYKWAPSAPVWWLDGRGGRSWARQRCPGPHVWFDAGRGTKCPDPAWKRAACSWPRWKRSACSQGSCSLHLFPEIPSAWRNLFLLRSKVYRWSIHRSISSRQVAPISCCDWDHENVRNSITCNNMR